MSFKNRKLIRPDAAPEQAQEIGVSASFVREKISNAEKESLKKALSLHNTEELTIEKDSEELSIGASKQLLSRKLLDSAPDDWNFFTKPNNETLSVMMQSIVTDGLINPIIVWEQPNHRYMILAGHTREYCFDRLFQVTEDKQYLSIPALVYQYDDLDEESARRIIILSNIAQRAKEDKALRIRSIGELIKLERNSTKQSKIKDVGTVVANALGVSRSTVFNYQRISQLIDPFLQMYTAGNLSVRLAKTISSMDIDLQEYLYANYLDKLSTPRLSVLLQDAMSKGAIDRIFKRTEKEKPVYHYTVTSKIKASVNTIILPLMFKPEDASTIIDALQLVLTDANVTSKTKRHIEDLLSQVGVKNS